MVAFINNTIQSLPFAENNHDAEVSLQAALGNWNITEQCLNVFLQCAITNVSFASDKLPPPSPPSAAFIRCVCTSLPRDQPLMNPAHL